jgi:hypothetical protein
VCGIHGTSAKQQAGNVKLLQMWQAVVDCRTAPSRTPHCAERHAGSAPAPAPQGGVQATTSVYKLHELLCHGNSLSHRRTCRQD